MIRSICTYLWSQQGEDGAWHSETHGILKGGQAYTPFILWTLLQVPDSLYEHPQDQLEKALQFIRQHTNEQGALGLSNPLVLEYPNYATAYALRVLARYGENSDTLLIQNMQSYLLAQQFDESRGISTKHPAYGGWGFGETLLSEGQVGHVDISHTRRVLQALREAGYRGDSTYEKASYFLRVLQKHPKALASPPHQDTQRVGQAHFYDGGFYYSSIITGANKAQVANHEAYAPYYRSYATATCDGLLSLLALRDVNSRAQQQNAQTWLAKNTDWSIPVGIPAHDLGQWNQALVLYHLAVRAEVYAHIGWEDQDKTEFMALLKENQVADGSFLNPKGARNKENDPLLGSSLALSALCYAVL